MQGFSSLKPTFYSQQNIKNIASECEKILAHLEFDQHVSNKLGQGLAFSILFSLFCYVSQWNNCIGFYQYKGQPTTTQWYSLLVSWLLCIDFALKLTRFIHFLYPLNPTQGRVGAGANSSCHWARGWDRMGCQSITEPTQRLTCMILDCGSKLKYLERTSKLHIEWPQLGFKPGTLFLEGANHSATVQPSDKTYLHLNQMGTKQIVGTHKS